MARITVITSSYPRFPGDGCAPFIQAISEQLAELGHAVEVVAPYDPAVRADPAQRVTVHRFRYAPLDRWHIMGHARSLEGDMRLKPAVYLLLPFYLGALFRTALRVARRQRADVIYAHWVLPNGLVGAWVARALHRPLLLSLHGSDVFVATRNSLFGKVAGFVFSRALGITACSPDMQRDAVRLGASPGKVHLVPYGIDPAEFSPAVLPLDRTLYDLSAEDTIIMTLGRLVPKKGFDVLVCAASLMAREMPRLQVVIGGDGPQRADLQQLAAHLGVADRCHFPGRIPWDQVPSFLAMADIVAIPSVRDPAGNQDGLPNVLIEALAIGKPIVATAIAGIPSVVRDGSNGLLCPPGDPAALATALGDLVRDTSLRHRLGTAARATAVEELDWHIIAGRIAGLLPPVEQAVTPVASASEAGQGQVHPFGRRPAPRAQKARKIEQVLRDFLDGEDLSRLACLDLGCGNGIISRHMTDIFGRVTATDYAQDLVFCAGREPLGRGLELLQSDGERLPFAAGAFDVVLCAQVYEHVANAEQLAREVWRVLRPGGVCFFSGPNRLALVEEHYWLPFLSWLPTSGANLYMRLCRRGPRYDIRPCTYAQLRSLWQGFEFHDYTLEIVRDPARYGFAPGPRLAWLRRLLLPFLPWLVPLLPNYNWILRRPLLPQGQVHMAAGGHGPAGGA